MSATLARILFGVSPAKAVCVSTVLHVVGLGVLGAWTFHDDLQRMEASAGTIVIQMLAPEQTKRVDTEQLVAEIQLNERDVLVLPERSLVANHWIRQVPSTVNLPPNDSNRELDPLDRNSPDVELPRNDKSAEEAELAMAPAVENIIERPMPEQAVTPPTPPPAVNSPTSSQAVKPDKAVGYGETPPRFTFQPSPSYPPSARARRLEGTVMVKLQIETSGRVSSVEVQRSSGQPPLDAAAVTTIRTWRCIPRMRGGQPIASTETIAIHFRLQ